MIQVKECDPFLDSSNMGIDDWLRIATEIGVCLIDFYNTNMLSQCQKLFAGMCFNQLNFATSLNE